MFQSMLAIKGAVNVLGMQRAVHGAFQQGSRMIHKSCPMGQMKGEIYRREPVKMVMEKGKTYNWCACGLSKKQPLCDGSHKNSPKGITPIKFSPDKTKVLKTNFFTKNMPYASASKRTTAHSVMAPTARQNKGKKPESKSMDAPFLSGEYH